MLFSNNTPKLFSPEQKKHAVINQTTQLKIKYFLCIIIGGSEMKRRDLIKKLEAAGFVFVRHGGCHDIYKRGTEEEKVPRHRELDERLGRAILKKWNL